MTAPASSPIATDRRNGTLAGEHEILMRDVTRRAAPVLSLLEARAWPHAELATLTNFLRTSVLRQVSDEEAHLFPHDCSAPPFAELSADHVRLHALTAFLEQVHARPCPRGELQAAIDELQTTLRRHLRTEQDVLAALPEAVDGIPSVADLVAAERMWLSEDDSAVVIDLDAVPAAQASELGIERLLRLRPSEVAELHAQDEKLLRAICRWLRNFDAARFGLDHLPHEQLLRVTCRELNPPAGIGYPA